MTQQPVQQPQRPVPLPDEASQPFLDGAQRGVLMIRRCNSCGTHLHPATEMCPECLDDDLAWVESSGRGTIFTFGVMHQNYHPAFTDDLPYNVTVVELEEGPRLNTNIVDVPNDEIEVGMSVEVMFEEVAEGVKLPKFRPVG